MESANFECACFKARPPQACVIPTATPPHLSLIFREEKKNREKEKREEEEEEGGIGI